MIKQICLNIPVADLPKSKAFFGALGFADPENRISFGYSPSFMCAGAGLGERCAALSAAVYA